MGVAYSTFNVWKEKYSAISEALKKGKRVIDLEIENALVKNALGFHYEEEKTYIEEVDGKRKIKRETIKRYARPDTTAQIIWLKNRKPDRWRDKPTEEDRAEQLARTGKLIAQTETLKGIKDNIEDTSYLHDLLLGGKD